jgi:hypothetical protein
MGVLTKASEAGILILTFAFSSSNAQVKIRQNQKVILRTNEKVTLRKKGNS